MSWECPVCTLLNDNMGDKCQACGTLNPDKPLTYPSGNKSEKNVNSSTLLKYSQEETSTSSEDKGWTCSGCSFKNSVSESCEMCFKSMSESLDEAEMKKSSQTETEGFAEACHDEKNDTVTDGGDDGEVRIVLLGRTGSGKSATANTILGENKFRAKVSGSSVTANCSRGESYIDNRLVLVVDTPGLFDTNRLNFEVTGEISKCVGMTSPGPHAVLLVIGIGRYTKEEQDTVEHFLQHFGEGVIQYMIIVFTREDSLKQDKMTVEEFIDQAPDELKEIVKRCKNRYIAIDNMADESEKKRKVMELFAKIDAMVDVNGGVFYTNAMYEAAEEVLAKRMQQIRDEFEQDQQRERSKLKQQISVEFEKDMNGLRNEKSLLENRLQRMKWEKEFAEKEKQSLHVQIQKLHQQTHAGLDPETNSKLEDKIQVLRRRQVILSQELQQKERQRLLMMNDLERTKYGINQRGRQRQSNTSFYPTYIDERTVRGKARDDVEQKSPTIFHELLESLKKCGKTFLSKAINFFTNLL